MTTVKAFQKQGAVSKWSIIYDLFKDKESEFFLSYDQIATMTGFSKSLFVALINNSVNYHLLKKHNKILVNVRGEGYKIANPNEQDKHADGRKRKGRSQIRKAVVELTFIDTSGMSEDQKRMIEMKRDQLQYITNQLRHNAWKAKKHQERAIHHQKKVEDGITDIQKILRNMIK